jgi:GNAT superfamily N-acetyltransferase
MSQATSEWTIRRAVPSDVPGMARVWLGPEAAELELAALAGELAANHEMFTGAWVAAGDDSINLVLLALPQPGAMATCWPIRFLPHLEKDSVLRAARSLWLAARSELLASGVRTFQAIIAPSDLIGREVFEHLGFVHVTQLLTLSRAGPPQARLPERSAGSSPGPIIQVRAASLDDPVFRQVLERTYLQSLDTPEMDNYQSIDEVLAGFASPSHELWLVLRAAGDPVGAVVLAAENQNAQLRYLGVIPEARRHGYGTQSVRWVLEHLGRGAFSKITVRLDVRNKPARRIYEQCGFRFTSRDELYVSR